MSAEPSPSDRTGRPDRRGWVVGGALFAVLLFQLIFGTSYVGAFHDPRAHAIPFGVSAPSAALTSSLRAVIAKTAGSSLSLRERPGARGASVMQRQIERRQLDGGYLLGTTSDILYIASAASVNEAESFASTFRAAAARQHRTLSVRDLAPLPRADPRGLAPFYLVITWVVGGYLGATLVGLVRGVAAGSRRLSLERVGALAAYAVISGLALTLLERAAFGIGSGHLWELSLLGALVVFAAAATASGLQALLGLAGTAVVLILFVALGNPSAGGAVSYPLLPAFFRDVGPFIVNGAGVDLARNVLYFSGHAVGRPLLVLAAWGVAGAAAAVIIGGRRGLAATRLQVGAAGVTGV